MSFYVKFEGDFTFTVTNAAIRPPRRHFKYINPAKFYNIHGSVEVAEGNDNGSHPFPDSPLNLRTQSQAYSLNQD